MVSVGTFLHLFVCAGSLRTDMGSQQVAGFAYRLWIFFFFFFFFFCMFYQVLGVPKSSSSTPTWGSVLPSIVETRDQNSRGCPHSLFE